MKMQQQHTYHPCTITLDTVAEYYQLVELIDFALEAKGHLATDTRVLGINISNWFTMNGNGNEE